MTEDTPIMPEVSASTVGALVIDSLPFGTRTLKLARPADAARLLDLDEVADAYERDQYMPYWATLWPAAQHLAAAVLAERWAPGLRAIELGCGLGLTGVAGLLSGLDVTFSDYDVTALRFAAENARLNGFAPVKTLRLDWRDPPPSTFDVVLGSDVIYEERHTEPVVAALAKLLTPDGVALISDQNRPHAAAFVAELKRHSLRYELTQCAAAPEAQIAAGAAVYRIWRG